MTQLGISRSNRQTVFAGVLFLGLLAMTARTATDPDLWWHLCTGQWIVETGHIPHADPFSFTRAGAPWVSHEWLSEIIFYKIWRWAGWAGLIAFSSFVITAGFMVLYRRCPARPAWAAAGTVLGALAAAPAWGVRPQMFTFLMASMFLWLMEYGERCPRLLIWIPVLFLPWLNLHAGFALGPALLIAYLLGLAWEMASGDIRWADVRAHFFRLLLALVACLALVPLNPSGAKLYRYPLDVLRSAEMKSLIVEWFSPDFHQGRYAAFLLILLSLLLVLATSRSRPKARVLFPLLGTMLAALDAVRHISIFVLVAMPVICAALPASATPTSDQFESGPAKGRVRRVFAVAVLLLMAGFAATRWTMLARSQPRAEADLFPHAAVVFLRSHPSPSRLFAYYDWGGYAIWQLYPEYRVFVDGRADVYDAADDGRNVLRDFRAAIRLKPGWQAILDDWHVQTMLMPPSSALTQALVLRSDWCTKYRDSQAVVFQRLESANPQPMACEVTSIPGQKVQKSFAKGR